jgi:hypothetical protein
MKISHDPLFREAETALTVAIAGAVVVMFRHMIHSSAKGMRRLWSMARGNGVTKDELHASQKEAKADILDAMKTLTYQIQPNANGGGSLPDRFRLIEGMDSRLTHRSEIQDAKLDVISETTIRSSAILDAHILTHGKS